MRGLYLKGCRLHIRSETVCVNRDVIDHTCERGARRQESGMRFATVTSGCSFVICGDISRSLQQLDSS
jgi:hypothetical protein